jgi:GNAT superfamily N-acetyltransferase
VIEETLCRFLEWDTEFFGLRIGHIIPERVSEDQMQAAREWAYAQDIDCLYYLADPDDRESVWAAENCGFRLVDVRLTLVGEFASKKDIPTASGDVFIRQHTEEDIPHLETIAAKIYTSTRFYFDPNFDEQDASRLYQTWIRKSCQGVSDQVWVAEDGVGQVGYITCLLDADSDSGSVGLFGVHPRGRGKGTGGALVHAALDWFLERECRRVQVVTQARNITALALYERMGFTTQEMRLWYHGWFDPSERSSQSKD